MHQLTIQIPQPCAESWDAMTSTSGGRHCAACQKTVVDFTQKTDAEILAYLAGMKGEACGRLTHGQLNRPLLPGPPAHNASRWRAWLVLALAAWGLRATSAAAGTPAAEPRTATHPRKKVSPGHRLRPAAPKRLRGTVHDAATHEPLAGVAVFLKGENRSAMTDPAGRFSLALPAQRPRAGRSLVLHYAGYQSKTVALPASAATMQLKLLADPAAAGATIVGYGTQQRQEITGGVLVVAAPEVAPLEELRARRSRSFWQRITQPFRPQQHAE